MGGFDKIRCSQWLQGMVLDGLEWFKAKNRKSMPASTNFVVNLGSRIVNLESGDSFATFFVVPDFS